MDELRLVLYDDIAQVDDPVLDLTESYKTKYWRGIDEDIFFSLILKRKNDDIQLIVDQGFAKIGAGRNDIGLDESMLMTYTIRLNLKSKKPLNFEKQRDDLDDTVDDPDVKEIDAAEAAKIKRDFNNTKKSMNAAMTSLINQVVDWIKANYGECPNL